MATSDTKLTMKLLIDTKSRKVLFAEAESNCVDFLFNILLLPVGTVIRLLKEKGMNGCLPSLYESIENINETYIQSNKNKDILLEPKSSVGISSVPFQLLDNVTSTQETFYRCCAFGCSNSANYITDDSSVVCPNCRNSMSTKLTYVGKHKVNNEVVAPPKGGFVKEVVAPPPKGGFALGGFVKEVVAPPPKGCFALGGFVKEVVAPPPKGDFVKEVVAPPKGGFVKEVVTYMVMDDLVVKPMSTISSIALLNKFNVRDVSVLQEEVVNFGMEEALELLKASFESKSAVLTSVFMSRIKAEI